MKLILVTIIAALNALLVTDTEKCNKTHLSSNKVITGADRTELYFPALKGKTVAVFANPTSVVGSTHLVDTLLRSGIKIKAIFGPEHGFRGTADAGEKVNHEVDKKTGIPIVSLYGSKRKPSKEDLAGVDVLLFDIQDVGVRFYTYINAMEYYIETALENNIPLIILDRPNPNAFYIDGPVLEPGFESGIGRKPVPIVYAMTMGEYAKMLLGEKWLIKAANDKFKGVVDTSFTASTQIMVVPLKNYTHQTLYRLPVAPSPNLKDMKAIWLYPSTCLFEGTVLSEGRGTDKPFQIFGHPSLPKNLYSFTPKPNEGAKSSKNYNVVNYGWKVDGSDEEIIKEIDDKIQLKYIIDAYKLFPKKDSFFLKNNFIDKLMGNAKFQAQIKAGSSESEIRKSWQPGIEKFKLIRSKYLLYAD